jgi:hypothetical protein
VTADHLPHVPSVGPGRYRVGLHGGGDCVYLQLGHEPSKQDPRVCVAFPALDRDGVTVVRSAARVAADIVAALNRD